MKKLAILGSTGSIGRQTLDVVRNLNKNGEGIEVAALSCNTNIKLLEEQVKEFKPEAVVITSPKYAEPIRLSNKTKIYVGDSSFKELFRDHHFDKVMVAVVGISGLVPTLEAIAQGSDILLANKETLVCGGELVIGAAEKHKVKLIPVDSEHSAIFQCLNGENPKEIKKLLLTCSGGPFYWKQYEHVTVEDALKHPVWKMGKKITIDSATLMNKALEIIEAKYLFNVPASKIDVVIHPQGKIHSMVEFVDGSIKAQIGPSDMRHAIQYALTYPKRVSNNFKTLDFLCRTVYEFFPPNCKRFPSLTYGRIAAEEGDSWPVVLNAANEEAVAKFLKNEIQFRDIFTIVEDALYAHAPMYDLKLKHIMDIDKWTRNYVKIKV